MEAISTLINQRWYLKLPPHRADREQWATGWETERWESICANIRPGDIAFDIGAEEGDLTALMAQWGARVVLFEPNDAVWPNPRYIFEANDLPKPLATYSGFAGAEDHAYWHRGIHLHSWPLSADGPVIGDHGFLRFEERPDVPQVTLDTFCRHTNIYPTLITMDVEGAEEFVVRGAQNILANHKPLVYISVHPEFIAAHYQRTDTDLYNFMESLGYEGKHLATDHEEHWLWYPRDGRQPV